MTLITTNKEKVFSQRRRGRKVKKYLIDQIAAGAYQWVGRKFY